MMNAIHKFKVVAKLGLGLTAFVLLIAGCSGGSSSSGSSGSSATAVETPSKVSVVNAK